MNVGKLFEGEINRLLEKIFPLVEPIYDIPGKRFTPEKLGDAIAMTEIGAFALVECKATRSGKFVLSRLKPRQRENLSTVADTKYGVAWFALNLRDKKGPGKAWLIPWKYWRDDFEGLWPKKSINLREAMGQFTNFELKRKTGGWEISGQLRLQMS